MRKLPKSHKKTNNLGVNPSAPLPTIGRASVMERAIKYYQGLTKLLNWRLRSPLSEPDQAQTYNLRDHIEAELDYLVSLQEEQLICV